MLEKLDKKYLLPCEKLCSKLGLEISIDSELNNGTKVTLIFPLSSMATFTDD